MAGWVPNALTGLRFVLVPFVLWTIMTGRHGAALGLFACAAVTDILDGAAARHFKLTSTMGAYLDPIADKVLLSSVFLALAVSGWVPWWLVGLILGRDVCILLGVGVFVWLTPIRAFPPSSWGKASTLIQVTTAVLWMGRNAFGGPVLEALALGLIWPCAAVTVASGVHYTWRGLQLARAH